MIRYGDIYYVSQKDRRSGDAILCARNNVEWRSFAVLLGDYLTQHSTPCTKNLIDVTKKYNASAIAIERFPEIERYGIIKGQKVEDSVYHIEDMVEKPPLNEAPSDLAITGRYILQPEIFDFLEEVPPGVGGEIQLTDAMRLLDEIYGHVFPGRIYDIGTTLEWLKSSLEIALENPEVGEEMREYLNEIMK